MENWLINGRDAAGRNYSRQRLIESGQTTKSANIEQVVAKLIYQNATGELTRIVSNQLA